MLHYTVCVWHSNYKISLLHTLRHISWYYVQSVFHENFHVMICHAGMSGYVFIFQTALKESRWVEQPEGDCGIEAGGVEAWKEQWEPVGLGGFGVSNEKLPEPRGGSAEFLGPDPDPGGLKIVAGNVGMAMRRCGLRRSAETCLLSCHVVSQPCPCFASGMVCPTPERYSDVTEFL